MEVKIGVTHANRELVVDTDLDAAAVEDQVRGALTDGGVLSLTDAKGRRIVVPAEKIAYIEISTSTAGQVGFRS
ncbi:DUF3107 domain-containing protein [Nocardioides marmoriginsengisoli]|uniref:DUF3107 domain-containing protein n=1 Tax=Nocardioides marmoriginsengisoli TaxID=661483 RepID=A0A3N0CRX9_9ACTN|nr:DUF3107 domain-containing protein [Nocardioides marmoriginsengisoli]RNL66217.1 DUF3107 domain-containing protein [Nocardioides marmoriginsengisoli]